MARLDGKRINVAGAGVFGLTCALFLARAGARVVVHDTNPVGDSASGVAAGMLAPVMEAAHDPLMAGRHDLLAQSRDLWAPLAEEIGTLIDRQGALWLGDVETARRVRALDPDAMVLDPGQAQARTWGLMAPGPSVATLKDWRLDARHALGALAAALVKAGGEVRQGRIEGAEPADLTVLACGYGGLDLAPELAALKPVKGQILMAHDTPPYDGAAVRMAGAYIVPGHRYLTVGATMEPGKADSRMDAEASKPLALAARVFPHLAQAKWVGAAGVRATTADGLPLVGPSAKPATLIAAGAYRNGWLLAPLVAQLITAYAAGNDPGPWGQVLDAQRFKAK